MSTEWIEVEARYDGSMYRNRRTNMTVIRSLSCEQDGNDWIHVSMSFKNRLPTYEDMQAVKEEFIGNDRWAVQIFPKASEHVNIMPYCLHLWSCMDQSILPDFTQGSGSI